MIGERTATTLAHLKAQGRRVSRWAPFGSRIVGDEVLPDAEELKVVRRILRLHGKGLSVRKIVDELTARAIPARGSRWHPTTVQRILKAQEVAAISS